MSATEQQRDVLEELASSLQIQAGTLDLHDAEALRGWCLACAQVLMAIRDTEALESQMSAFIITIIMREERQLGRHTSSRLWRAVLNQAMERGKL
jgi:hypothetical protein